VLFGWPCGMCYSDRFSRVVVPQPQPALVSCATPGRDSIAVNGIEDGTVILESDVDAAEAPCGLWRCDDYGGARAKECLFCAARACRVQRQLTAPGVLVGQSFANAIRFAQTAVSSSGREDPPAAR
jgi:hypothetical protein